MIFALGKSFLIKVIYGLYISITIVLTLLLAFLLNLEKYLIKNGSCLFSTISKTSELSKSVMIKLIAPLASLVEANSSKDRCLGKKFFFGENYLKALSIYLETMGMRYIVNFSNIFFTDF